MIKNNIDTRITTSNNSIATKANLSALINYYTVAQIDSAVALKQNRADLESNYYNKSQIDSRLANVASGGSISLDNYYTKSQLDTTLAAKQNVTDFNIAILDYFTKAEVNASLLNYYNTTSVDQLWRSLNTSLATKANTSAVYDKK